MSLFADALAWFKAKKLKISFDYRDVWKQEHTHAFTVAKVMQEGILVDIKNHLDDAIEKGTTFEQFKKELTPLLQAQGWWGIKNVKDPKTGRLVKAQLGSPRRLRTIFDANLRTARAAGQWGRFQRTKKALPFLVYELGPSLEHRDDHVKWAGIILPIDHPFWLTHFTPNGYGCKCRIRQVSQREKDRLIKIGQYTTTAPKIEMVEWLNKRTGEVEKVPKGIDPGWDNNPGIDRDEILKKLAKESAQNFKKTFKK